MPADSPPEGWRPSLVDDQHFTSTTSFTQQDVNDGTVWYRHFGSSSESDSFQFQVGAESVFSNPERFTIQRTAMFGFLYSAQTCNFFNSDSDFTQIKVI